MGAALSRVSALSWPRLALLLFSVYFGYRYLFLRSWVAIKARNKQQLVQKEKKETRLVEFGLVQEALVQSEAERKSKQQPILESTATSLVQKLSSGTYSSRLVLHSLLARLMVTQAKFNVLSETNFAQALSDAEAADQHYLRTSRPLGRLHGLPISLKDSVNLAGKDTTLGLARFAGQPAAADALIVQLLKKQGAIFYAKSNIPQTLLSFECCNPVYGVTTNPYNINLTPGGSSGGESAMLACGASVVGIGTDIGGSVRIPAHFSGNTALKPTARRLSLLGFRPSVPGQEAIPAVAGPMASCVQDLSLLLRELWTPAAWEKDADLVPIPFNEKEVNNNEKLRVGYYVDDGFMAASPACARAVLETVDALKRDGHTVVEFKPPRMMDCIALYYSLITSDNCETVSRQLDGEIWEDYSSTLISNVRLPVAIKSIVAGALKNFAKDHKAARLAGATRERSVAELWALQSERKKFRQDFFDAWTAAGDFDVLLTPVHVLPAVPHHSFKLISFTCSFTLVFNVLDLPAGVLPITSVDAAKDIFPSPPSGILEKTARKYYQLSQQKGLPVGVQVVGRPFKDETVLRAMRIIEKLVQFKPRPPCFYQ